MAGLETHFFSGTDALVRELEKDAERLLQDLAPGQPAVTAGQRLTQIRRALHGGGPAQDIH